MANSGFAEMDASSIDRLAQKMDEYGAGSGQIVQNYLRNDAFDRISGHIPGLIHASNRKWKGKATSATVASPTSVFKEKVTDLTLTVSTTNKYNYLYFPDDGSNSKRHAGNQQFMQRGVDDVTDEIVQGIIDRLIAAFEED